jgi:hypothetical protein
VEALLEGILDAATARCTLYKAAMAQEQQLQQAGGVLPGDSVHKLLQVLQQVISGSQRISSSRLNNGIGVSQEEMGMKGMRDGTVESLAPAIAMDIARHQQESQRALAKVSDIFYVKQKEQLGQWRDLIEHQRGLLFSEELAGTSGVDTAEGGGSVPCGAQKICLHLPELGRKLHELEQATRAMNVRMLLASKECLDTYLAYFMS